MKVIPYGRQSVDEREIKEIIKVLKSGWISQGPRVEKFEKAIARYCGAKYAVAVSSGTAALHLACKVAGLEPGDEAITTPMTFLATANAVLMNGAKPVFADINEETLCIDPEKIRKMRADIERQRQLESNATTFNAKESPTTNLITMDFHTEITAAPGMSATELHEVWDTKSAAQITNAIVKLDKDRFA